MLFYFPSVFFQFRCETFEFHVLGILISVCKSTKVTLLRPVSFLEHNEKEKLTSQWTKANLADSFLIFVIPKNSYYVELFVPALFIAPGNISALRRAALPSNDSGFYLMIQ